MRVVLLGAGLQAQAACFDLVQQSDVTEIVVADTEIGRAEALARLWGHERVRPAVLDASDEDAAAALMQGMSASPLITAS